MSYSHTTFGQLKTTLANRLGDTTGVYWLNGANSGTTAELGLYIKEALRTWGLLTGYWRDSGQIPTVFGTGFYSISGIKNTNLEDLLSYTVTDKDLSYLIQYHLLEPSTGSTWVGSEQFTLADVTDALTHRRDQFLLETQCTLALGTQVVQAGAKIVDFTDTTLTIRRLSWKGATSSSDWALYPEDTSSQRNYSADYLITPGLPQTYSSFSMRPLRIQVAPPPNENGLLTVFSVNSGVALNCSGIALGIPDDMSWIVKWGALADLLGRQGPGQDLGRSYFCERRWRLGVELAKLHTTVVNAEINGVSLPPDSVANLDQYNPNWYSTQGIPASIASLRNYVALSPAPDGIYSVLLDVVRKAVLPTSDGDFVQIGREYLNVILDYAEHLAAFKSGGYEFRHTYRAAENFFAAALVYNQTLAAKNPAIKELIHQSFSDDYTLPVQRRVDNKPLQVTAQQGQQTDQMRQTYSSL